jgi:hypothetical protein
MIWTERRELIEANDKVLQIWNMQSPTTGALKLTRFYSLNEKPLGGIGLFLRCELRSRIGSTNSTFAGKRQRFSADSLLASVEHGAEIWRSLHLATANSLFRRQPKSDKARPPRNESATSATEPTRFGLLLTSRKIPKKAAILMLSESLNIGSRNRDSSSERSVSPRRRSRPTARRRRAVTAPRGPINRKVAAAILGQDCPDATGSTKRTPVSKTVKTDAIAKIGNFGTGCIHGRASLKVEAVLKWTRHMVSIVKTEQRTNTAVTCITSKIE